MLLQGAQKALESALAELQREDPGLCVTFDPETGQTVLGGMGELHLEVIRERIRAEHKIDADLGPLQIAYKESLRHAVRDEHQFQQKIGILDYFSIEECEKNKYVIRFK